MNARSWFPKHWFQSVTVNPKLFEGQINIKDQG